MRKGVIATIKPKMVVEERRLCEKKERRCVVFSYNFTNFAHLFIIRREIVITKVLK